MATDLTLEATRSDSPRTDSAGELNDPELLRQVNALRKTDNLVNWYYLAREYLFLGVVIGATIWFGYFLLERELSLLWMLPVLFLSNLCVGAGQHRLATLTHEASHYMLFRNRLLNEFVSEWFCMYPLLGTTHSYRVQHLGHHQYPNDPDRDPDWTQMTLSGHKYRFPMTRGRFLWECFFKQFMWPPNLIRYVLVRASFKVDKGENTPYKMKRRQKRFFGLARLGFFVAIVAALAVGLWEHYSSWRVANMPEWLGGSLALPSLALPSLALPSLALPSLALPLLVVPAALWAAGMIFLLRVPESWFEEYAIKSDIPVRWSACMRFTFNALLAAGLAWATVLTGMPWWLFYVVLWLIPLGTSFAFFMILRQIVQHGNADRERFTNTRVFVVHPLLSMSVFPIGNDYHLPHHLFPMVPHYNLRKLHALLMDKEIYRHEAIIVEGYFFPPETPPRNPTVVDVMTR